MVSNTSAKQQFWDDFSEAYAKVELVWFQGGYTSFVMTNAQSAGARILEVGCASGVGSEIVAQSIMSKQGAPVLVVCDFSGSMVQMSKRRFEESDFALIQGNKASFDVETDYASNGERINLDKIVTDQGTFRKLVYGCQASGSALPFPDAWFTSYVSNLVLQLIDSPENQIKEAFRVLKPGSMACFTVWGRKENSLLFTAQAEAARRQRAANGEPEPVQDGPAPVSNFDVGYNMDHFIEVFRTAGFAQVKRWFQPTNHNLRSSAEFIASPVNLNLAKLDQGTKESVMSTYDDISGTNSLDLKVFEVMVVLAYKD